MTQLYNPRCTIVNLTWCLQVENTFEAFQSSATVLSRKMADSYI